MITLTPQEDCVIYYTSDGTIPGEHSSVYQGPIPMDLGNETYLLEEIDTK